MLALFAVLLAMFAPSGKNYDVQVSVPPAKVGQRAIASVHLVPKPGFHVNQDFPMSLSLSAPPDITLGKDKLGKEDAKKVAPEEALFEVAFTPSKSGTAKLEATFRFAVCTEKDCFPSREKVVISTQVK